MQTLLLVSQLECQFLKIFFTNIYFYNSIIVYSKQRLQTFGDKQVIKLLKLIPVLIFETIWRDWESH